MHRNVLLGQLSRARVDQSNIVKSYRNGSIHTKKVLFLESANDRQNTQLNSKMLIKNGWEVQQLQSNFDLTSIIENLDGCTMILIDTLGLNDLMSPIALVEELRFKGYRYAIVCLKQNHHEDVSHVSLYDGVVTKPLHECMQKLDKINTSCYIGKIFNINAANNA